LRIFSTKISLHLAVVGMKGKVISGKKRDEEKLRKVRVRNKKSEESKESKESKE
jgi:hypothetical protein